MIGTQRSLWTLSISEIDPRSIPDEVDELSTSRALFDGAIGPSVLALHSFWPSASEPLESSGGTKTSAEMYSEYDIGTPPLSLTNQSGPVGLQPGLRNDACQAIMECFNLTNGS